VRRGERGEGQDIGKREREGGSVVGTMISSSDYFVKVDQSINFW